MPGRGPIPGDGRYEENGLIKRQAARLPVYGYDKDDKVIAEIIYADARITRWVHLANRKAAWYEFKNAMDLGALSLP